MVISALEGSSEDLPSRTPYSNRPQQPVTQADSNAMTSAAQRMLTVLTRIHLAHLDHSYWIPRRSRLLFSHFDEVLKNLMYCFCRPKRHNDVDFKLANYAHVCRRLRPHGVPHPLAVRPQFLNDSVRNWRTFVVKGKMYVRCVAQRTPHAVRVNRAKVPSALVLKSHRHICRRGCLFLGLAHILEMIW